MTTLPPLCPRCVLDEAHDKTLAHPPVWPCLYCYLGLHPYCDPIRYACSCACGLIRGDT